MHQLTKEQRARIRNFVDNLPDQWQLPYVDADDLNDICLDGHFSLDELRTLVTLLTKCEAELLAISSTAQAADTTGA